jgi:hypothetical protein
MSHFKFYSAQFLAEIDAIDNVLAKRSVLENRNV